MANEAKIKVISDWLDENLNSIDPGTDEIAQLIFGKMLVEHSCCPLETWVFADDLYLRILRAGAEDEIAATKELTKETGEGGIFNGYA